MTKRVTVDEGVTQSSAVGRRDIMYKLTLHPNRCLRVVFQISYLDAILGNDNVNVEVVDGSVEIKVPAGCQPETVLRIRSKGAPQLNNANVGTVVLYVCLM